MRLESILRDYYAQDISRIDPALELVGKEYSFPGGRVDLCCRLNKKEVAIELKAKTYDSRRVAVQLLKYLGYFDEVWFVAPKVRYSVYASLKQYHPVRLSFFEIGRDLSVVRVPPNQMDDTRPFPRLDCLQRMMPRRYPLLSFSWEVAQQHFSGRTISDAVLSVAFKRYGRKI